MKTMLIIDMQKLSFTPKTPRYKSEQVINVINKVAMAMRKNGDQVIYIQHDGSPMNFCYPNTTEWEILDELTVEKGDLKIGKSANDAFYNSTLLKTLHKINPEELIITGCATDFCVDATVKTALVQDFNTTVIADGHTTADRPFVTAKQVIDHYNWLWNDFSPTKGCLRSVSCEEFLIL